MTPRVFVPTFVLLALVGAAALHAAVARVSGTVIDQNDQPLERVTVTARALDYDWEQVRTTNKKGRFTLVLMEASRSYTVRFEKEGYRTVEEPLEAGAGEVERLTWRMVSGEGGPPAPEAATGEVVLPPEVEAARQVSKRYQGAVEAFNAGELEDALAGFQEAATALADRPEPYAGLAMTYLRLERYDEAVAAADRLLEIEPGNLQGLEVRHEAYRALGDSEKENEALDHLVAADPSPANARRVFNAGVLALRSGDNDNAIARFEQAAELDPSLVEPNSALARLYFNRGDHDKSAEAARRALELDPGNSGVLGIMYLHHLSTGDEAAAGEMLDSLRDSDPEYLGGTFFEFGVNFFNNGETATATTIFEQVLAAVPDHPKAHYMLALCRLNVGDQAGAKPLLERFIELAPDDPDASVAKEMLAAL